MNIIFLGAPGSGKCTQSKLLVEKYDLIHLSTGDILRSRTLVDDELGRSIKNRIDNGMFVDDETMLKLLEEKFQDSNENRGYLLDGYPRNLTQAQGFDKVLNKLGRKIDKVINLEINDEVIFERITGRWVCKCGESYHSRYNPPAIEGVCDKCGKPLYQRADDNIDNMKVRLLKYYDVTRPLINYYYERGLLANIDALQSIKDVNLDIQKVLEVHE